MGHELIQQILQADNLPSLPAVALKVLQLTRKDDISLPEIAQTIEQDPALTAKLLKMVNSSLFALPNKIGSVRQAMVVLGLRSVKVLALSFSLVNQIRQNEEPGFDYEQFWKRSLTMAVCSLLLAERHMPAIKDEAFVSGLLSDLGILAATQCARKEYRSVLDNYFARPQPMQAIEEEILGLTHAAITRELLHKWSLPESVLHAVAHHHDPTPPEVSSEDTRLSGVVWSAAKLADLFCEDLPVDQIDTLSQEIADYFTQLNNGAQPIAAQDIHAVMEAVNQHVCTIAKEFSLSIGQIPSYDELRIAAISQLTDLSMTAELDRAVASRQADDARKTVESLTQEKQALAREAGTDPLTQLANRKTFDQALHQALNSAVQSGKQIGLLLCDLDFFKRVNDTYGHLFGDEVLKMVGALLNELDQQQNLAARYGGEEFAIISLKHSATELKQLAEDIRRQTETAELHYGTKTIKVTTSIGVAQSDPRQGAEQAADLISRADKCLYLAKQAGRNKVYLSRR
ncbi:MAG: hypothetical protein HJJLKODD_01132 [Phycisphaerae bacterium]|nr:hypothetical protein [Phycisphaerae bacterium]